MAEKKIYQHHERDSEAGAISDIQTREIVFSSDIDYLLYETAASTVRYVFTMSEDAITEAAGVVTFTKAVVMDSTLTVATSLDINSSVVVTGVLDEDNMASDSPVKLCTQQSIKAYVATQVATADTWAEVLANGNTSGATDVVIDAGQSLTVDTNILVVNASGYADKVGIGTAAPDALVHLKATSGSPVFRLDPQVVTGSKRNWAIRTNSTTNGDFQLYAGDVGDNDPLAGSVYLTVSGGGNFGVGVTDPDSLLEVAGTAHIQGDATLDSGGKIGTVYFTSSTSTLESLITSIGSADATVTVIDTQTLTGALVIPENIYLDIQRDGFITGAYTLTINGAFQAGSYQVFENNVVVVFGALSNNIKADWFENTVTGMTQLRVSLDTEQTGSITFTSGKTYNVGAVSADVLFFASYTDFKIYGNGAVLSVSSSAGINGGYGLRARDCVRFHVENLTIDGNRDLVDDIVAGDGQSHGIFLESGSQITIDNIYAYNMRTDGMYIGLGSSPAGGAVKDVTVTNCKIESVRRNGISVVTATDVLLDKIYYLNNGDDVGLSVGVSPKTAIDLEPNDSEINTNITISNGRFTGSVDDHIEIANTVATHNGIKIFGNTFDDVTGKTAIKAGSTISNLDVFDNTFLGRGFGTTTNLPLVGFKLHDNFFNSIVALVLDGTGTSNAVVSDNSFYVADLTDTLLTCSIAGGDPQEVLFSGNTYYIGGDSLAADYDICTFNTCLMKDETFIRASGVSNSYRIRIYSAAVKAENIQAYGSNIELYDETAGYGFDNIIRIFGSKQVQWLGTVAPASGTFATGSKVYLKTPTSGGTDYYSCTVAGTPGTWLFHNHDGESLGIDGINSDGGAFAFDTTGDVTFNNNVVIDSTKSLTVDTSTLVVNASGYTDKLGFGTAAPAALVHIKAISGSPVLRLDHQNPTGSIRNWAVRTNSTTDGDFQLYAGAVGDNDPLAGSAYLTVSGGGNIGIGVTGPQGTLDVGNSGSLNFDLIGDTGGISADTNVLQRFLVDGVSGTGTRVGTLGYDQGEDIMTLSYGGNNYHLNIDSSGNVGIGTGTPGAKVEILGDTNKSVQIGSTAGSFTTVTYFSDLATLGAVINLSKPGNGNYSAALFTYDTTAGAKNSVGLSHASGDFVIASDILETMRIERGGDIGIGTNDPDHKVDISQDNDGADTGLRIKNGSAAGSTDETASLYFNVGGDTGSDSAKIVAGRDGTMAWKGNHLGNLQFYIFGGNSDWIEAMRIDSFGNVGINDNTPSYKLDVNGTFRVVGEADFDDQININDTGSVNPTTMDLASDIFTIATPSGEISLTTPLAGCSANFSVGADLTVTGNDINDAAGAWLTSDGAGALRVNGSRFTVGEDFDSTASFNLYNDGSLMSGVAQTGLRIEQDFASGGSSQIFGQAIDLSTSITGTTTNLYNLYIDTLSKGAGHTITTQYGLYINSVNAATNNYAIYTGAGKIWFNDDLLVLNSGSVGIGTATPDGSVNIVNGTPLSVTADTSANDLVVEGNTSGGISILASDAGFSRLVFGSPSDNFGAYLYWQYGVNSTLGIGTDHAAGVLALSSGSSVVALTLDASQDATFAGDITVSNLAASRTVFTDGGKKLISRSITDSDISRNRLAPFTMTVTTGSLTSGTVSSVQDWEDGTNVEIQEATGAPGINVVFTFASVDTFSSIAVSFYYKGSSSHSVDVEIYDDTNTTWRPLFTQIDEELNYDYRFCDFPGTVANYINVSEEVKIRFYHSASGITSHDLFINYVSIVGETT